MLLGCVDSTNMEVQVGEPPNDEDEFWLQVANNISPEKSLERLDAHGKYLFGTVSVVGTLLTGFGIFSPSGATVLRSIWIVIPILLACLSLAFAMMGITPELSKVNRQDINSVRKYYNDLIRRRGRFIFLGGLFFALSLISIVVVLPISLKVSSLSPIISVRLVGVGEKASLTGKVEIQKLPRNALSETEIFGYVDLKENIEPTILFSDISHADQAGNVIVSTELDQIKSFNKFVINCRVKSLATILYEKKVEIRR
jgi:hypothetical protein